MWYCLINNNNNSYNIFYNTPICGYNLYVYNNL